MFRSLSFVMLICAAGGSALAQTTTPDETSGVVHKNQMSDLERDRLMDEAMAEARRQLEEKQAEEETKKKAEAARKEQESKAAAERAKQEAEKAKQEAEAKKAAELKRQEELAAQATKLDTAKQPTSTKETPSEASRKAADIANGLTQPAKAPAKPPTETVNLDKKPEEKPEEKKPAKATADAKPAAEPKSEPRAEPKAEPTEPKKAVVIEEVPTKSRSRLTVKREATEADMPQPKSYAGESVSSSRATADSESAGRSATIRGRVIGIMRPDGGSRFLMEAGTEGLVQVIVSRDDLPAIGAEVTVAGKRLNSGGRLVVQATSVSSSSSGRVNAAPQVPDMPAVAAPFGPPPLAGFAPGPMMMPPPPMMMPPMMGPPMGPHPF